MSHIFAAVLTPVWKRKETKLFLVFSLYPIVFYISSFFPNSEFMKIRVEPDYRMGLLEVYSLLLGTINSLTVPTLALYYLTYTVFKKEIDDAVMFLYKDITRFKIFLAKLYSLLAIVTLFLATSFLVYVLVHYVMVVKMPYGSAAILPGTTKEITQVIGTILINAMDFYLSIFIAMLISFYLRSGATMVTAFIVSIITSLLPIFGGKIAMIYPTGYLQLLYDKNPLTSLSESVLVSVIYVILLSYLGLRIFQKIEF